MAESSGVLEGFLCPICLQDLGSVVELKDHFEIAHSEEDKALLNQLKGLFGMAKRKLLRQEFESDVGSETGTSAGGSDAGRMMAGATLPHSGRSLAGFDTSLWEPQELGVTRYLTDSFRSQRSSRIDRFVLETNKLLIRLDKLISDEAPTDPNKRRAYEKSIVSWAPDSDCKICTVCGKSFSLTRRRHHCRLCGRVLCHKCSHFLSVDFARKLTDPAFSYEGEGFHRSGSSSSINSAFSSEGDAHIRTCNECRFLLERRDEQASARNSRPPLVILYEKIRGYKEEADQLLPNYSRMAAALNTGDSTYSLEEAEEIRAQITKLYENIATLNKRILVLGQDTVDSAGTVAPQSSKSVRLQQMIAASMSAYVQENLVGLTVLPSRDQLDKLRAVKRAEAERRIAEERRVAAERERVRRERRDESLTTQNSMDSQTARYRGGVRGGMEQREVVVDGENDQVGREGWKPVNSVRPKDNHEDPMVQQMNIIRGYITEARRAARWDELVMLEDNLRELQTEYWIQQHQQQQQQGKQQQQPQKQQENLQQNQQQQQQHRNGKQTNQAGMQYEQFQNISHSKIKQTVGNYRETRSNNNPFDIEEEQAVVNSDKTRKLSSSVEDLKQLQVSPVAERIEYTKNQNFTSTQLQDGSLQSRRPLSASKSSF